MVGLPYVWFIIIIIAEVDSKYFVVKYKINANTYINIKLFNNYSNRVKTNQKLVNNKSTKKLL